MKSRTNPTQRLIRKLVRGYGAKVEFWGGSNHGRFQVTWPNGKTYIGTFSFSQSNLDQLKWVARKQLEDAAREAGVLDAA